MTTAVEWADARATAHIYNWSVDEVRPINVNDPDNIALMNAGLLEIVDPNNPHKVTAAAPRQGGGCGCGK